MTTKTQPTLTDVRELADDLIRALSEHPGDDRAVCEVLNAWHEQHDTHTLALVCMAAMRTVFSECLIPHPARVPADGLTLATPEATA